MSNRPVSLAVESRSEKSASRHGAEMLRIARVRSRPVAG